MGTGSALEFERDIFISYAQLDNESLTEEEKGWVSAFHYALNKRLGQLLGRKPEIWRDPKLQGNDILGDEIVAQFPKLKVLVSILSPRYVRSEWCQRELRAFYEAATAHGGISLDNKLRVFKVVKTPIQPPDEQPAEIGVIDTFRRPGRSFLMPPAQEQLGPDTLIDISHESLIRNWTRLKGWVEQETRSAGTYRRLAETAQLHLENKAGYYRDPELQIAHAWAEQEQPNASWALRYHPAYADAMSFLKGSVKANRLRKLCVKGAVLLLVVVVAGIWFGFYNSTRIGIRRRRG